MSKSDVLFGNLDGSNLVLLNTIYDRPTKFNDYTDCMNLIVKDVATGEKHLLKYKNPRMRMYVTKPEYRDYDYIQICKELDKCDIRVVKCRDILDEIAKEAGERYQSFLSRCRKQRMFTTAKNVHKYPYVFGTDYDLEDYYRIEWLLTYGKNESDIKLTKMYLDIETDGIDITGVPTKGECPINACSITDPESKTVFVFLLRTKGNDLIPEFELDLASVIQECHDTFDKDFGVFNYTFFMFDDNKEIDLIRSIFKLINTLKRDFVLTWGDYDMEYFIDRIVELGYSPLDIIPHKDFDNPKVQFIKDKKHFDIKNKNNKLYISSYSVFINQMALYAKTRKGQSELKSFKLDYIANNEIGTGKIVYVDEANIKTLPYKNFRKFVIYNIKDTLLQYGIEERTSDVTDLFEAAYENCTKYSSVFSQTVFLKNRGYVEFYEQGFIIGNNKNSKYEEYSQAHYDKYENEDENEEEEDSYEGALVGNPLNIANIGMNLYGYRSQLIHNDVIDFDFSSMYPNAISSHNIGVISLIGKVIIKDFAYLNPDKTNLKYDQGREFIDEYTCADRTKLCSRYFNLPTCETLIKNFRKRVS